MHLTEKEKRMLGGDYGPIVQKSMDLLLKVGEFYGAERMLKVTQAHLIAWEINDILFDLFSELTKGATLVVPTTVNPLLFDLQRWQELGIAESDLPNLERMQSRLANEHRRLGVIPTYTCHPHFQHELRLGEHIAFTESNVQIFANAWFGARSNIEGATTAIAAAVTGRTPEYGLHIEGNRRGEILVEVDKETQPESFDYADYGALSFWTGRLLTDRIPVYIGLSDEMTAGQAKYMCAPQVLHSSAATFHIVGVTPEARSLEEALGGAKAKGRARFGKKERREAFESLCSAKDRNIDLVCLGCPHCTLDELAAIAGLLKGKKVNGQTRLWVGTNEPTRNLAKRMGIIDLIVDAGGHVLTGMCSGTAPILRLGRKLGIRTVASNSACLAGILSRSGRGKFGAWFGRTRDCIAASINGKWEGR